MNLKLRFRGGQLTWMKDVQVDRNETSIISYIEKVLKD